MAATDGRSERAESLLSASGRARPYLFDPPEGWHTTGSWRRAQIERDQGGPLNDSERVVLLDGSDDGHRVFWALTGATLRCKCGCKGFRFGPGTWCAHLGSLWWRWVRGRIDTAHVDTGRRYRTPPAWLEIGETADADLDKLTPAETDAWLHTVRGGHSQREWAHATGRAHGTIGNLVRRAKWKLGEGSR